MAIRMKARTLSITLIVIMLSLTLAALPAALAQIQVDCEGCQHTIKVVPVGSTETGDPIVTSNPANLIIFHTGSAKITNVWLLLVLNEPTYNALDKITINGTTFMTKTDFQLVTAKKIPPTNANPSTHYPGSLCQYEVSAIKDNMNEKGNKLYYGMKSFLPEITKNPTYFKFEATLTAPAKLKILVLALGRCGSTHGNIEPRCIPHYEPFNACNSFSKSTLVVPEMATLAMAAAPFGALGLLYTFKRRKK